MRSQSTRGALRAGGGLAILLLGALAGCGGAAPPPHVIVISIDTLRRDALAAFAPEAGPLLALDRLARDSVRFENALSSASWTLPAHASLLTGLYPDRHGATDRRVTLASQVPTLAERLAARGYETAAFTGGGFLDPEYGLGRGFERYAAKTHGKQERAEDAEGLLARVADYLDARRDGRPLFLFLHTYAVHNYYDARDEAAVRARQTRLASRKAYVDCVLGRTSCPEETWETLEALYRAELELLDDAFARLVAELERAGLWHDAIVVLLSDHGEGFEPARGRIHHGGRLHADQLAIPLLVRVPGVAPRAEAAPVSLVDLMPTLLELTGTPVPPDLDGRSLAASLRDGTPLAPRPLLAMEHYFGWEEGKRDTSPEVLALPRELAVIDADGWYITGERPDELYGPADADQATNRLRTPAESEGYRARLGARPLARAESERAEEGEGLGNALDALGYGGGEE
ncbi:MAG TPA: sulfatase [Planctomycetota bacterium]